MRILVLLPRFPYPLDKGDKLRAYHQIVELSKRHEIYVFALSHCRVKHDDYDHLSTYCAAVDYLKLHWWESIRGVLKAFLTGKPLQLGVWDSCRARRAYTRWEQQVQPDVVYCQMVRTMPMVAGSPYRKVLDFQDSLSLNTRRRMERSHGLFKLILRYEYQALQRTEQEALRLFDATTVISQSDRDTISQAVTLVPNGVDTDYFETTNHQPPTYDLVFTGNMSYAPNVDAARYLVKEIMPLVWKQCPQGITVLIAGADPKHAVKSLAGPNVTISGRLPDIREAYASAKIFVAPMRIGSGMQNKLLEAMSMGLPCVTTSLAATPLGMEKGRWKAENGEDSTILLVGDTPQAVADHIVQLLNTQQLADTLADRGHRFAQEHFSWSAAVASLEKILTEHQTLVI